MSLYPNLAKPIKIGNQIVKNRIFMPPLSTNLRYILVSSSIYL